MEKIKIIEPCHEKWAEFTPTQKGAFCKKCAVDVIDFSSKSNDEIKTILVSNSDKKMCGRFTNAQLNDYNSDYHIWQNQNNHTFQSKFVLSLLLAFGITLFSCTNTPQDSLVIGEIELFNEVHTLKEKIIPLTPIEIDSSTSINLDTVVPTTEKTVQLTNQNSLIESCIDMNTDSTDLIMGDVEYIEEETHTKGKMAIEKKK